MVCLPAANRVFSGRLPWHCPGLGKDEQSCAICVGREPKTTAECLFWPCRLDTFSAFSLCHVPLANGAALILPRRYCANVGHILVVIVL